MSHFQVSSVNEVICHGIPDRRKLREGDIVNIGTSPSRLSWNHLFVETCETEPEGTAAAVNTHAQQMFLSIETVRESARSAPSYNNHLRIPPKGLHADLNETYPVGDVDQDSKKLMRVTRQALDAAIQICKPGALIRDIGKIM